MVDETGSLKDYIRADLYQHFLLWKLKHYVVTALITTRFREYSEVSTDVIVVYRLCLQKCVQVSVVNCCDAIFSTFGDVSLVYPVSGEFEVWISALGRVEFSPLSGFGGITRKCCLVEVHEICNAEIQHQKSWNRCVFHCFCQICRQNFDSCANWSVVDLTTFHNSFNRVSVVPFVLINVAKSFPLQAVVRDSLLLSTISLVLLSLLPDFATWSFCKVIWNYLPTLWLLASSPPADSSFLLQFVLKPKSTFSMRWSIPFIFIVHAVNWNTPTMWPVSRQQ